MKKTITSPIKTYLFLIFGIAPVFLPLLSRAATPDELRPKPTIISGKVKNFAGISNVITVYSHNSLNRREFAQDLTKTNGEFHTVADYVFAQDLIIYYRNHVIPVFIEPGDSIFVDIDAWKLRVNDPKAVTFTGNNPEPSRQIAEWQRSEPKFVNPEFDPEASVEEYCKVLDQLYNERAVLVAEYSRTHEMSEPMQEWAVKNYIFTVANCLPLKELIKKNIRWDVANAPAFDLYNDRNFQSSKFATHLNNSGFYGLFDMMTERFKKGPVVGLKAIMTFLSENIPEGAVRDMILYTGIKNFISDEPEIYEQLPEASKFFSQQIFDDYLRALVIEKKKLREGISIKGEAMSGVSYLNTKNQIESLPSIDPIVYLKEKHKDKVIYIDVWATFCGPCIEEMKHHAPALHKYFEGKDVVFVNLCLTSGTSDWTKAVATYKIGGENYFFDRDASAKFMALYDLPGYPSYLLLDKTGNIVTNRAPRPSNLSEAIKQIEAPL